MSYYYIDKNPHPYPEHNEHQIHNDNNFCSNPPFQESKIGLGNFSDCKDATIEARRRFSGWETDGCKYCNRECYRM